MKTIFIFFTVILLLVISNSCIKKDPNSIKIGTQIWSSVNLNVDHFRNGDAIPHAKSSEQWMKAGENKTPAWCYYDNDAKNAKKHGKLYNWFAVVDSRGLAPEGWHVPTDVEWKKLSDFLGGDTVAGTKMKNNSGWDANGSGDNSTGFTGLPGGCRLHYGGFSNMGNDGSWWSQTEDDVENAWYRDLNSSLPNLYSYSSFKDYGFSVRCVKD